MFDELSKYKQKDHFFFKPTDSLSEVCNAPRDKSGVYLVHALSGEELRSFILGVLEKCQKTARWLSQRQDSVG